MDHLQSPKDPSYPPLEILDLGFSYTEDTCIHVPSGLCQNCDDGGLGNWSGFPDRMGWRKTDILEGRLRRSDTEQEQPADAASFLQAWLYFGVLAFFFNDVNVVSSFLRQKDDGTRVIDTSPLLARLLLWRQDITAMSALERAVALKRLKGIFGQLDNLCTLYLAGDGVVENFQSPVSPELSLSIQVLGETLYHAVFMAGARGAPYLFGIGNTPLLVQRLKEKFWCQRDITNIGRICLTYYASLMGRRYHQISHDGCTNQRCQKLDIDESRYQIKHIRDDCRCDHVSVPVTEVIKILENDQVPIVRWYEGTVQVTTSGRRDESPKVPYVAMSHVWADGLGNPKQNSLPFCQVERIQNLVDATSTSQQNDGTPTWFWMDTLCVPITKDGIARKAAIIRMYRTYQEAVRSLVLDAELTHRSRHCSSTELALRIVFSRWSQRLWTLQEAVATPVFLVQFADGFVNSNELETTMSTLGETVAINDALLLRAYKWFRDLAKLRQTTERDERLLRTFQSTIDRTTSHVRDELICTASLVGFNQLEMGDILQNPEAQRVCAFLRILGKAPKKLVFAPGPKRTEYGFRWCPVQLLGAFHRLGSNPARADFHSVTKAGLQGTWQAIRFSAPSGDFGNHKEMNQHDFILHDRAQGCHHWVTPMDSTAIIALKSAKSQELAILLEGLELYGQDTCCLVDIVKDEGGLTFARLIVNCVLQLYEPARQYPPNSQLVLDVEGDSSPTEGIWCIE